MLISFFFFSNNNSNEKHNQGTKKMFKVSDKIIGKRCRRRRSLKDVFFKRAAPKKLITFLNKYL